MQVWSRKPNAAAASAESIRLEWIVEGETENSVYARFHWISVAMGRRPEGKNGSKIRVVHRQNKFAQLCVRTD
jgi:hypothetical protein